ncbi:hypothetical protein D3C80_1206680 [compost metagenome]
MVGRIGVEKARGAAEAGIVDQAVNGQAARGDSLDQGHRRARLGQIGGDHMGAHALSRSQVLGQGLQRPLAPGRQDQVIVPSRALSRQGRADAGAGPRDQDGLAMRPQATRQAATGQDECGAKSRSEAGSASSRSAMVILARASPAARSAAVKALAT